MKSFYKLTDGKTVEIEVSAELAATLADFIREDKNKALRGNTVQTLTLMVV